MWVVNGLWEAATILINGVGDHRVISEGKRVYEIFRKTSM
jgi:hypothetical protein